MNRDSVVIRELMPDDAQDVARIESMFHDRSLADGAEAHRGHLSDALDQRANLSVGAFSDGRLVGYLLCYGFEPTVFANKAGMALYLEDLAVVPEFRFVVSRLIGQFISHVNRDFPEAPVEAHMAGRGLDFARKHERFWSRLGFSLQCYENTGEVLSGQERYRLRWHQRQTTKQSLQELLQKLPGHSIEHEGRSYELKVVEREADWPALDSIWDSLLLATPEHTVFQSYAYQRLWWRHFGGDSELFIVLIVQNGAVAGIAPLRIEEIDYGRQCRQLCFIGTRWEVDRPTFLFPASDLTLTEVLVTFLARRTARWDICDLHEQTTGSPLLRCLESAFRSAGFLVSLARDSDCPYLELQGTWQEFLAGKSQRFRKNLKASDRKLRELGDWQYRTHDTAPEVLEQLDIYRAIEARSWKNEAGVGVSRSDEYFEFYRELAETFASNRAFVVRMITVDGRALAGTFGVVFDGIYYSLQIAHDREADRCSPGTYLEALEVQECFELGVREYEFLGGFLNNKSRWTTAYRRTTHLRVFPRTPFFIALYFVSCRLKPWVKDRIRPYMKSWQQNRMEEV